MKAKVSIVLLVLSIYTSVVTSKFSFYDLVNVVNDYVENGKGNSIFWKFLNATRLQNPLQGRFPEINFNMLNGIRENAGNLVRGVVTCAMCNMGANMALSWLHAGATRDQMVEKIVTVCTTFNLQKKHVCRGIAEAHIDVFLWIIEAKNGTANPVTPADVCGLALYPKCPLPPGQYEWSLDLEFLGPKPPVQQPSKPPDGSSPTLKVLQITDVHVDPLYLPGGNARCGEPCCCRSNQDAPRRSQDAAGYWGDYRDCDLPVHSFKNMLQHAATTHPDIAYVMFTGDVIDHGVWATSVEKNRDTFVMVMDELRHYFPDVTVLPVLGNHEPHPLNAFTEGKESDPIPTELSSSWLYELAAEKWGAWLPSDQRATIARAGYYSHQVQPGLLAVVINNNVCYNFNWWLLYSNYDPSGQLMWLAETLLEAEKAGQKIHLLAHIAGNSKECLASWRREYQRIIHRFENTVVAQFHGHTHYDHFNIYYDHDDPSRATNVAFTAGSGTTYSDVNPNYRLYTVDGEHEESTYRVLDHETWFYNLTEANLAGPDVPPNWQKLYTFSQAYGVPSLLPADLDALANRMAADTLLQDQYYSHYVKLGDTSLSKGCNSKCRRDIICDIITPDPDNPVKCRLLTSQGHLRVIAEDEVQQPHKTYLDEELDDELDALLAEVEQDMVKELEIIEMKDIIQEVGIVTDREDQDRKFDGENLNVAKENDEIKIIDAGEIKDENIDSSSLPVQDSDVQENDASNDTNNLEINIKDLTVNDNIEITHDIEVPADDTTDTTVEDTIGIPEVTIISPEDTIVIPVTDNIEIHGDIINTQEDTIHTQKDDITDAEKDTDVIPEENVTDAQKDTNGIPEDTSIVSENMDENHETITAPITDDIEAPVNINITGSENIEAAEESSSTIVEETSEDEA